jgi:hypothetical protein
MTRWPLVNLRITSGTCTIQAEHPDKYARKTSRHARQDRTTTATMARAGSISNAEQARWLNHLNDGGHSALSRHDRCVRQHACEYNNTLAGRTHRGRQAGQRKPAPTSLLQHDGRHEREQRGPRRVRVLGDQDVALSTAVKTQHESAHGGRITDHDRNEEHTAHTNTDPPFARTMPRPAFSRRERCRWRAQGSSLQQNKEGDTGCRGSQNLWSKSQNVATVLITRTTAMLRETAAKCAPTPLSGEEPSNSWPSSSPSLSAPAVNEWRTEQHRVG